jgi:Dyp-type peroxidase family
MWRTAGSLGDGDISAWKHGNTAERTPHVLVILGDVDSERLKAECETFVAQAELRGLTLEFEECGSRLHGEREHFGFRDGISVPVVRGTWRRDDGREDFLHPDRQPDGNPLNARWTLRGRALVWPGQAAFGYPTQSPIHVLAPGPAAAGGPEWMTNGSLLVFRRLRQHVERFKAFTEDAARELGLAPEHVGAMLVGRWPNGTPLVSHPRRPGPDEAPLNDFTYVRDGDLHGVLCPHTAHIRKVNPRDAPTDRAGEARTLTLQPFRRGIPFVGPSEDGVGEERGLLFLAYTTSIRQGFGALSLGWMNRADGPEAGRVGPDTLAGRQAGERRIRLGDTEVVAPTPWVEPTGGGYFFAPAISLLGRLARDEL